MTYPEPWLERATLESVLLWAWPCAICGKPRGQHVWYDGQLCCADERGMPKLQVWIPTRPNFFE